MEKTAHPTYAHCPIRHIVDRFGDKWSLLVLYNLHTSGCLRFSEIHRRTADISQKMLTSTLRKLEQDGLLSRKVYPEVPPRVEYALTPRGESLMPHLTALIGWAEENFDAILEDRERAKDIATARACPANQADTCGQPPVVSRRQNVVSRQQNKDAPTTSNRETPIRGTGAPQARQREPIAPPGNAPAKASAGGNEIGIRHIPSTKKVPSGTFPILPFHRHRLRAVRCRTPDRSP